MTTNTELDKSLFFKPLSQNDNAMGWRLVVPRVKKITKTFTDEQGNIVTKIGTNIYRTKINLAQLPSHLWHKRRTYYNGTARVSEKSHQFLVESTLVDFEIKELVDIIKRPYDEINTDTVVDLLNILKDNNVYGWPVIMATSKYAL